MKDNCDVLSELFELYSKLHENVLELREIIEAEQYELVENQLSKRTQILKKIVDIKTLYNNPTSQELEDFAEKIKQEERENIEKIENQRTLLKTQMENLNKQKTFIKAYSGELSNSGEILDLSEGN